MIERTDRPRLSLVQGGAGMPTSALGPAALRVSAIGLGCMGMSALYGPADRDESLRTLRRAVELGVDFLDTADVYGAGANEVLVGEFLAGQPREDMVVATKFGAVFTNDTGMHGSPGIRGDAEYVRTACEASLRRLGTDYIDLYYLHVPDPRVPIEETVGAMAELVVAGKVRQLGLSNVRASALRAAYAVHPITAVQSEWSLFTRQVERSVVPACAELGVGFVPYSPLGRGFLTGVHTSLEALAADDFRRAIPRFAPGNSGHNLVLLKPIHEIADAYGISLAQVALAWLLHQQDLYGVPVVPIPGTRNPARLAENLAATGVTLSPHDLALLEPIASQVVGAGHPPPPPGFGHLFDLD
jgi:aryl-alcohol dehydrogenase-like predicted oxidoreductase